MPLLSSKLRTSAWQAVFACLDRIPARHARRAGPQHLLTGAFGEEAALFHLRQQGFTVVAHGWKSTRAPGDLDLVAWEGDVLCFIEVKTRSRRAVATAESAVDFGKRRALRRLAGYYLRQLPEGTVSRFDVVVLYGTPGKGAEFQIYRNAFGWHEREEGKDSFF
jgi:putative endonuclease